MLGVILSSLDSSLEELSSELRDNNDDDVLFLKKQFKQAISFALDFKVEKLKSSLKEIELLCREIRHEKISPELLDFLMEEDLWKWVNNEEELSKEDEKYLINLLQQEMLFLLSVDFFTQESEK